MNTEVEIIMGQFERIFNKYEVLRKQPIQYDENTVIYRSELHMIEVVGNYKDINITKLANVLGITRGGASQGIDKLCKKQMILKKPSPLTDNEVVLTLTERGKKALNLAFTAKSIFTVTDEKAFPIVRELWIVTTSSL